MRAQRSRGARADRGHGHARQLARVAQVREELVGAGRRGHAQQVVGAHVGQLDLQRLRADRGRLDDLGAEPAQPCGERARLRPRAGHGHRAPVQRPRLEPRELLAQRRDRPDERDRRRADALHRADLAERRQRRPLPGQRAPLDDGDRLGRRPPARHQLRRDPRQRLHAHVEHQSAGERRQRGPVQSGLGLVRVLVPGHERDPGRQLAVRDGHARVGRGGDPRGHARDDLVRDPGLAQHERLLAAAPEHERVAALEAHDASGRRCRTGPAAGRSPPAASAARRPACRRRRARRRRRRAPRAGSAGRRGSRRRRRSARAPARSAAPDRPAPRPRGTPSSGQLRLAQKVGGARGEQAGHELGSGRRPRRAGARSRRAGRRSRARHRARRGRRPACGRWPPARARRGARRPVRRGSTRGRPAPRLRPPASRCGPGWRSRPGPRRARRRRRAGRRPPPRAGAAGRARRRRGSARRPRPRPAWPGACRRSRAARRPRGPAGRPAAARGGAARSFPPARLRARGRARPRPPGRRTARLGAAWRRSRCPGRARPARPWPSAPRGRSRPTATPTPTPRPSGTCRRAHGRRRPRS